MAKKTKHPLDAIDDDDLLGPINAFLGAEDARVSRIMLPLRGRYVSSDRDKKILEEIRQLVKNIKEPRNKKRPFSLSNRNYGFGIAIVAPSGAGKSTTLNQIFLNHAAFPGYGQEGRFCSLVSVDAPSPCTRAQLGNMLLDALGYGDEQTRPDADEDDDDETLRRTLPADEAWRRVRHQMWRQRRLVIHIGDMNHVMHQANPREIKKVT
jgi:AAA domain